MQEEAPTDGSRFSGSLRTAVPAYFPPREEELRNLVRTGIIAFDTNALFDAYRFSPPARSEFFAVITEIQDRAWIPHRVAEEFMRGRYSVIAREAQALDTLCETLDKKRREATKDLIHYGKRHKLPPELTNRLTSILDSTFNTVSSELKQEAASDLDLDEFIKNDPVLSRIETLFDDGKVGLRPEDLASLIEDGEQRIAKGIPPGFCDKDKPTDRAVGDYLIWMELIQEAQRRKLPVLFVTNEEKPDWVRKESGRTVGPLPELVEEMLDRAGVGFHLVNVRTLLQYAADFLSVHVSRDTVDQAEQLRKSDIEAGTDAEVLDTITRLLEACKNEVDRATHRASMANQDVLPLRQRLTNTLARIEIIRLEKKRNNSLPPDGDLDARLGELQRERQQLETDLDAAQNVYEEMQGYAENAQKSLLRIESLRDAALQGDLAARDLSNLREMRSLMRE